MPSGEEVADYLWKKGQVELGESPWSESEVKEGETAAPVEWDTLFPRRKNKPDEDHAGWEEEFGKEWADTLLDDWEPDLGRDFTDEIKDAVDGPTPSGEGIDLDWDVCAWYQPIHFYGHDWGIYIREDCIRRQAAQIGRFVDPTRVQGVPPFLLSKALLRASTYSYFLHERYHHKTECLGIRMFVVEQAPRYTDYSKQVYQPTMNTDDNLEEALANADSYRSLGQKTYRAWIPEAVYHATREALIWAFRFSPPGYRMADRYISGPYFNAGENRLHGMVHEGTLSPSQAPSDWDFAPRLMQSFFKVTDGIWTVVPTGAAVVLPTPPVAPVRTGSTADLLKLLSGDGYVMVRGGGKGSHIKLKKPGAQTLIMPSGRGNISPGVARNISHALGIGNVNMLRLVLQGTMTLEQARLRAA